MSDRPDLQEALDQLRSAKPDVTERYGVESLAVFGSVLHGSASPSSDLDVLVTFRGSPPGLLRFVELQHHLSDLLGVRVDLVTRDALKPGIRERVLAEAVAA